MFEAKEIISSLQKQRKDVTYHSFKNTEKAFSSAYKNSDDNDNSNDNSNDEKKIIQEGKYESVRNRGSVMSYMLKDVGSNYITNMCLPIVGDIFYNTPEEHLLAILKTEGFELIHNKLYKTLTNQGLKPMDAIEKNFDPDIHEAITKIPSCICT